MAVVPRESRIEEMRRLGLSLPLLRLAQGEQLHDCLKCFTFASGSLFHYGPEPDEEMRRLLEEFPEER